MDVNPLCTGYLNMFLYTSCLLNNTNYYEPAEDDWSDLYSNDNPLSHENFNKFEMGFQWQYINYSWPNRKGSRRRLYNPENIVITSIKIYEDNVYVAMPQIRKGVPFTLGYFPISSSKINPLIIPYPNFETNIQKSCSQLQSVFSMEIDTNGFMWVLDGYRLNNNTKCAPKLVIIDLKHKGRYLQTYIFPKEVSLNFGGFLRDIVIDDYDKEDVFAYITDNSIIDPGLIVYSKRRNIAWKLRDKSMFAELNAARFIVGDYEFHQLSPISSIALSSMSKNRFVYFGALAGYRMYSIDTFILKKTDLFENGMWRRGIRYVGRKKTQSDGIIMDNCGNLYYGLLSIQGIGLWNTETPLSYSKIIEERNKNMVWIGGFAMDNKGYLYVLANNLHVFMNLNNNITLDDKIKIKIMQYRTETKSYLYE